MAEISAHFGCSVLHLHKRATLSFRPITASRGRSRSHLDGHEGGLSAPAAALDLEVELFRRLTGPEAGGGELDPGPGQVQAAGRKSTAEGVGRRAGDTCTNLQTHESGGAEFPAGSMRRNPKVSLVTSTSAAMT